MKKILATLLATTMLISSAAIPTFAAGTDTLTKRDYDTRIKAEYNTIGADPDVDTKWDDDYTIVSVTVDWSDTNFTYDFGKKWDPDVHEYVDQPGWNKDYIDVKVTNHSNCPVNATIEDAYGYNDDTYIYYADGKRSADMTSAINDDDVEAGNNTADFRILFDYIPTKYAPTYKDLISFDVVISGDVTPTTPTVPEEQPTTGEEGGEHEHHYVYDQFGRLVCTGCNSVKHEYCIDEDEDGLCDECGLERDFCPDCHIGGTCKCI